MSTNLPYGVTRYYASLAECEDPYTDPIAGQYIRRPDEDKVLPYETPDPLADGMYEVSRRVIHHYRDRILILANDRCATYCRHCFRRHFTGNDSGRIREAEIRSAGEYIAAHAEVQEVLISGGDPLMLPDEHLLMLCDTLRRARPDVILRLATRIPVVQPARITEALAQQLSAFSPLWVVTHANHPAELTDAFRGACARLVDRGIPMLNQAVLLKGVNDSADTLETLFRGLLRARVKPYYLFQGDLAAGTSHFRTSIDTGLSLMKELRGRLSGMAIPTYAVDLPGGGGKVVLDEGSIVAREPEWYVITDLDGNVYRYPRE